MTKPIRQQSNLWPRFLLQRRPILNFMAAVRAAAAFLNSMDCTDHMAAGGKKDAAYIACKVISVVKEFGAEDVVQVIMDGANKATWPIITKEFPHLLKHQNGGINSRC